MQSPEECSKDILVLNLSFICVVVLLFFVGVWTRTVYIKKRALMIDAFGFFKLKCFM